MENVVGSGVGSGSRSGAGSGTGSISQRYGSRDPDPHQNVTDPQHCWQRPHTPQTQGSGCQGTGKGT
jgi:hypothetical protein